MKIEQAVIIDFNYGIQGLDSLFTLEDELEGVINEKQLGEYDGNEVALDYSDGKLFIYGPDAKKLFDGIKPILDKTSFMKGARVRLRFGPAEDGVDESIITI